MQELKAIYFLLDHKVTHGKWWIQSHSIIKSGNRHIWDDKYAYDSNDHCTFGGTFLIRVHAVRENALVARSGRGTVVVASIGSADVLKKLKKR